MNADCLSLAPDLAALPLGALEPTEHARVLAHLESCSDCRAFAALAERELAKTQQPGTAAAPENAWERLEQRIAASRAERDGRAGPALRVVLSCTFCHGGLEREAALFCASCLAPHHGDCFDRHGRCAAPGCSETRAVAPRERTAPATPALAPGRSRRAGLLVALVLGSGSVAALVTATLTTTGGRHAPAPEVARVTAAASPTSPGTPATSPHARDAAPGTTPEPALADVLGEPDRAPPAYPWAAPTGPAATTLRRQKVTFNFAATPLLEVVSFVRDITGLEVVVDEAIDQEQAKVNLRLKDVILWSALRIIVEQLGLGFWVEGNTLKIGLREQLPETLPADLDLDAAAQRRRDARDMRLRLEAIPLSVEFDEMPLGEAIEFLRDVTAISFVVSTAAQDMIDNEQIRVTCREKQSAAARLDALLAGHGMVWQPRNGVILVSPEEPPLEPSVLAAKRVTLSLRGATVPELIQKLREQGVETLSPETTWLSSGTISVVCRDEPLESFVAALSSRTPLRAYRLVPPEAPRELLLLDSVVPSVRQALAVEPPAGFAGVAGELSDLKRRLLRELPERASARAAGDRTPVEALAEAERAVDLDVSQILALVRRAERYSRAEARKASIDRALERMRTEREGLVDKRRTASDAAQQEAAAPNLALATADQELEEAKRALAATAPGANLEAATARVKEAEKRFDAAAASLRELEKRRANDEVRLNGDITNHGRRIDELTREFGVTDLDIEVAHKLERGVRLAEAEGR